MPVLSDSEERLLDHIREGRVDAEIGVRLGLNTGEVRERIAALAAKLGVQGKAELAAFQGEVGTPGIDDRESALEPHRAPGYPLATAAILAGVVLFALGAWLGRSTADEGTTRATPAVAESPTAVVTQPPPTVPPAGVRTLGGVLVTDLGQLVTVPGHVFDAVVNVDQREALAVVTLAGPGVVRFPGPYLRAVRNGSLYGEGTGPFITVFAFPADRNTELIPIDSVTNAVYAKGDALPRLLVWATETRGVAQDTRGLRPFHATVDASGELIVSVDPVSPALAINSRTGESLDLSHARRIGVLPPLLGATVCDPGEHCVVQWSGAGLLAPFDGVPACSGGSMFEYDDPSSGLRLALEPSVLTGVVACPSARALQAGDLLGGGAFVLRGMDAAGRPIALAVAGDGSLYAGDIVPKVGCPCVPGN